MTFSSATAVGVGAMALWASLAILTVATAGIPPLELLALTFGAAFLASTALTLARRGSLRVWRQPWQAWALSFAGLFLYHALYFFALKSAPPAEAGLINYLWPLLIVLFSPLSGQGRLRWQQLLGGVLGFAGTAVLVLGRSQADFGAQAWVGYLAALSCAFVWALYSVFNQRFRNVPTDFMGGICGLVALAGAVLHGALEQTVIPNSTQWLLIIGLGLGPTGLAFFAWDYATKHGRLALLGTLSYLIPLVSTLLLIAGGYAQVTWPLLLAALLIIGGAAIAAVKK